MSDEAAASTENQEAAPQDVGASDNGKISEVWTDVVEETAADSGFKVMEATSV
jgi:hypothetical protein